MRRTGNKWVRGATLAALAIAVAATPAAAGGSPEHGSWTESYVVDHACGIVEATTVSVRESVFVEDGEWVRTVARFEFDGVFTGPTGKSYTSTSHQVVIVTPDTISLSGQGLFLRGPGGVLAMDTGHLVLDRRSGETTRKSARAVEFDDAAAMAAFEAALCAKLG